GCPLEPDGDAFFVATLEHPLASTSNTRPSLRRSGWFRFGSFSERLALQSSRARAHTLAAAAPSARHGCRPVSAPATPVRWSARPSPLCASHANAGDERLQGLAQHARVESAQPSGHAWPVHGATHHPRSTTCRGSSYAGSPMTSRRTR